jgi:hypothetical protein
MTEDDELNESIYSAESGYRIDDIIGDLARRRIMRIVGVRERVDRSGTCTTAQHHPNKRRSSLCHVVPSNVEVNRLNEGATPAQQQA